MSKALQALKPVKSSNVESVGYDAGSRELAVKFKSGGHAYVYQDVPAELHDSIHKAESAGKFINQNVVGKFTHNKVAI